MTRTTALRLALAGSLTVLGLLAPPRAGATDASLARHVLAVVVGARTPLEGLSRAELRRLFLTGQGQDDRGRRLVVVNVVSRNAVRIAFDRLALGMGPDEIGRYWIDRKLRGQGMPPRSYDSAASVRQIVAAVPGTIGYVTGDLVDRSVRTVRIDGLDPHDPDYPLVTGSR